MNKKVRVVLIGVVFAAVPAVVLGLVVGLVNPWLGCMAGGALFGLGLDVMFNSVIK